jgi:N-acetylglucosamine-6-phosphate deacetylase
MKTAIIYAKIISNDTIIENGKISIDNGIINGINQVLNENNFDIIVDAKNNFLSPGFIDLHIHGGGGYYFMDGSVKAFTKIAETHIKYGTTTLMPMLIRLAMAKLLKPAPSATLVVPHFTPVKI